MLGFELRFGFRGVRHVRAVPFLSAVRHAPRVLFYVLLLLSLARRVPRDPLPFRFPSPPFTSASRCGNGGAAAGGGAFLPTPPAPHRRRRAPRRFRVPSSRLHPVGLPLDGELFDEFALVLGVEIGN